MELTKMDGKSKDVVAERLAQLKALIPEAFTEGKIDFDALKGALGEAVDSTKNHYSFTWNKKEEYRAFALRPSMGTLRPCVAESSGKDGTPGKFDSDNLYIEGENLEVLKLLQGSYYGKVKMIYIDPPYNTGKDFVYEDDFHDSVGNYKAVTGQTDDEGRSTRANAETSGRYHTDWLNMMFPRLLLARNLLRDDGVIFVSIDDNEICNLRRLMEEIFGEVNFLAQISVIVKTEGRQYGSFAKTHEYLLGFAKSIDLVNLNQIEDVGAAFRFSDDKGGFNTIGLRNRAVRIFNSTNRPNLRYPFYVDETKSDDNGFHPVFTEKRTGLTEVWPSIVQGLESVWRWGRDTASKSLDELVALKGDDGNIRIFKKDRELTTLPKTVWAGKEFNSICGTREVAELLGEGIFNFPKPLSLLNRIVEIGSEDNDLILDFFSGSATCAHAVFAQSVRDLLNRRFILVQMPELTYEIKDGQKKALKESKAAFEAGYENICEIGKERIRRAGAKIKAEVEAKIAAKEGELKLERDGEGGHAGRVTLPDIGFKVFKLDTSNLIPWNPNPEDLEKSLLAAVDNAVEGRTVDDILYEVLLKCNLPLTLPIVKEPFGENTINVIGEGALMICLDKKIPATVAEEMIRLRDEKYKPVVPMQVVFIDNGFTDKDKANAIVTLKQAGVEEKAIMSI